MWTLDSSGEDKYCKHLKLYAFFFFFLAEVVESNDFNGMINLEEDQRNECGNWKKALVSGKLKKN